MRIPRQGGADGGLEDDDIPIVIPAGECGPRPCLCRFPDCSDYTPTHPTDPDPWDGGTDPEDGTGPGSGNCFPPGNCNCTDSDGDGIFDIDDCDSPCYAGDPNTDCECQDDDGNGTINQNECPDPCGGARSTSGPCACEELGVSVSIDQACDGDPPLVWVLPEGLTFQQPLDLTATGAPAGGTYEWTITMGDGTVAELGDAGDRAEVVLNLLAGGMATAEVTYTVDLGNGLVCEATDQIDVAIVESLRIEYATFQGDHAVARDTGMAYDQPEWLDKNLDGDVDDDDDHHWPIAYTRNKAVTISEVVFKATPVGLNLGHVDLIALGVGVKFEASASISDAGSTMTFRELESSMPLENVIAYEPNAVIGWELTFECGSASVVEVTEHTVYVTLGEPTASPLYETVLDIACRNAAGLSDVNSVVDGIWGEFLDLDVRRVDGVQMKYWNPPSTVCQLLGQMLAQSAGNGACGAWAELLKETLRCQGLATAAVVEIVPSYGADCLMLVKDWQFAPTGTAGCTPFTHRVSETADLPGAAGQGNPDPPGAFYNHYILHYDSQYYDPSYGTGPFGTLEDHENASINGFFRIDCIAPGVGAAKTNDLTVPEMVTR